MKWKVQGRDTNTQREIGKNTWKCHVVDVKPFHIYGFSIDVYVSMSIGVCMYVCMNAKTMNRYQIVTNTCRHLPHT